MLCSQLLLLLLLLPAQNAERSPAEILREIQSLRNEVPAKVFVELAGQGTVEACNALIKGIDVVSKIEKKCTAYQAFSHFNGVPEAEELAVNYLMDCAQGSKEKLSLHATLHLGTLWPAAQEELVELALKNATADGRSVALMHLVENGMPLTDKELSKLARSTDLAVRYEGRLASAGRIQNPEDRQKYISKLARSKKVVDRLVAAELLANEEIPNRFEILAQYLGDKDARVFRKTVSSLERARCKESVAVLIARLSLAKPGEAHRMSKVLQRLTGMMFGSKPEVWQRWWKAEKADFQIPSTTSKTLKPKASIEHTGASFYGLPIYADRLVLAFDSSDSMKQPAGKGGLTRFEIAKKQMSEAIEGLPKASSFDVVHFGKNAWSWNEELTLAKSKNKRKALEYVESISLSWGTEIYCALRESFRDPQADAILFMTDGDPQLSLMQNRVALQRMVTQWNRTRHTSIDCITIGVDRPWLRRLAQLSGGRYTRID